MHRILNDAAALPHISQINGMGTQNPATLAGCGEVGFKMSAVVYLDNGNATLSVRAKPRPVSAYDVSNLVREVSP